jgi:DUF971 family protein
MSIWDYMKPAATAPEAVNVELTPDQRLVVTWSDGAAMAVPARTLRQQCPCAACVDEWTHQRTLAPDSVPADVRVREVKPVGNYAVQLDFSDGHATGIFTWVLLRELGATGVLAASTTPT